MSFEDIDIDDFECCMMRYYDNKSMIFTKKISYVLDSKYPDTRMNVIYQLYDLYLEYLMRDVPIINELQNKIVQDEILSLDECVRSNEMDWYITNMRNQMRKEYPNHTLVEEWEGENLIRIFPLQ